MFKKRIFCIVMILTMNCLSVGMENQNSIEAKKQEIIAYLEEVEQRYYEYASFCSKKLSNEENLNQHNLACNKFKWIYDSELKSAQKTILSIFSLIASGEFSLIKPLNDYFCCQLLIYHNSDVDYAYILGIIYENLNSFFSPILFENDLKVREYMNLLTCLFSGTEEITDHINRYIFLLEEMGKSREIFCHPNFVNILWVVRHRLYDLKEKYSPEENFTMHRVGQFELQYCFSYYKYLRLYGMPREIFDRIIQTYFHLVSHPLHYIQVPELYSAKNIFVKVGLFQEIKKVGKLKKMTQKVTTFLGRK